MTIGRDAPAIQVRVPEELKRWLKHQSVDNRRTLNSEVLHRLEESRRQEEQRQTQGAEA